MEVLNDHVLVSIVSYLYLDTALSLTLASKKMRRLFHLKEFKAVYPPLRNDNQYEILFNNHHLWDKIYSLVMDSQVAARLGIRFSSLSPEARRDDDLFRKIDQITHLKVLIKLGLRHEHFFLPSKLQFLHLGSVWCPFFLQFLNDWFNTLTRRNDVESIQILSRAKIVGTLVNSVFEEQYDKRLTPTRTLYTPSGQLFATVDITKQSRKLIQITFTPCYV
jgi:hypothetical protein